MLRKFAIGWILALSLGMMGWHMLPLAPVQAQDISPTPPDVAPTIVLEATPTADPADAVAPTPFNLPTPAADGKMYYVIQPGDSLIRIATIVCGPVLSCVDTVKQLNQLDTNIITVGQKLIVGPIPGKEYPFSLTPNAPVSTATPDAAATAINPSATPTTPTTTTLSATPASATTELPAGTLVPSATVDGTEANDAATPTVANNEPVATAVVTATLADSGTPNAAAPTVAPGTASVCVRLYDDKNGNSVLDGTEQSLAQGEFALVRLETGDTVGTYLTDGVNEPYCFEALDSGEYRVIATLPNGYVPTTANSWNFSLAAASTANLEFGAQASAIATPPPGGSGLGNRDVLTALLGAFGVIFLVLAAGVSIFLLVTQRSSKNQTDTDNETDQQI